MSERPLPTVIGPTENALRTLLSRVLTATAINGYDEWVTLNVLSAVAAPSVPNLAAALEVEVGAVEQIADALTTRGLLADLALTPTGAAELSRARSAVAAATATLLDGIEETDQQIVRTVLDTIRDRAEAALGRA